MNQRIIDYRKGKKNRRNERIGKWTTITALILGLLATGWVELDPTAFGRAMLALLACGALVVQGMDQWCTARRKR